MKICSACNAVLPGPCGRQIGDMFDGEGFVRAARIRAAHPCAAPETGSNDPAGFDIAVGRTPPGMKDGDPPPFEPGRLSSGAFVGEVATSREITPLPAAAPTCGHDFVVGTDMLIGRLPAHLEVFGRPSTDGEEVRRLSQILYGRSRPRWIFRRTPSRRRRRRAGRSWARGARSTTDRRPKRRRGGG